MYTASEEGIGIGNITLHYLQVDRHTIGAIFFCFYASLATSSEENIIRGRYFR